MLFNSHVFLFLFLPACLTLVYLASFLGQRVSGKIALILASLAFYAYWRVDHVWIILASILVNYFGVRLTSRLPEPTARSAGLAILVSFNLGLIGVFKYLGLIVETYSDLTGVTAAAISLALPLGISFFSFQQIAYVIDFHRGGRRDDGLIDYSLAVLFFPHLIAGPLVKYRALIDQFSSRRLKSSDTNELASPSDAADKTVGSETPADEPRLFRPTQATVAAGLTIVAIGLFKKVFLADSFAVYANTIFNAAESGISLATKDAWIGAVSFFFQIYFDFSGYSDMAVGLALFFGIKLPANFLSPYMSRSIVEFWRRWHITLSNFLRDYVYISLGGNRHGVIRRHINLLLTMLIGGLWHGASWTFVVWGGLHGVYLVINHLYSALRKRIPFGQHRTERAFYWLLTLFAVLIAWVYFRAESFGGAHRLLTAMFDFQSAGGEKLLIYETHASTLPGQIARAFKELHFSRFGMQSFWLSLALLAACITFLLPNTYELFARHRAVEGDLPASLRTAPLVKLHWRPSIAWLLATSVMLTIGLLSITQVAQFIYFEF
ncbi:MAG: MBOAT family O-acyltransferase [Hyphomonadaceae bacterium]